MILMKNDPCCEFCFEPLAAETSYRLVAWEFMGTDPDGPEFAYELCRQCYYEACRAVCDLIDRILALQTAKLKARAQAVGLEI
jgi:hypothetical protein